MANQTTEPEDEFGHRFEGDSGDGRSTIVITPEDEARTYRYFPATYESVKARVAPVTALNESEGVPVELLIKGAFPDACTVLHDVVQERTGHIITIELTMRRPQGAVCATVMRPYRFYLALDGLYSLGSYTIKMNDRAHPFMVLRPE